jgi:putative endonuclease
MESFYYVYILISEKDGKNYTGFTHDFKGVREPFRVEQHKNGEVESTKNRRPLELIYFEGCLCRDDATKREKYLKTHYGKMFLKNRLAKWFSQRE